MEDCYPVYEDDKYDLNPDEILAKKDVPEATVPNHWMIMADDVVEYLCSEFRKELVFKGVISAGLNEEIVNSIRIEKQDICCGHGDYRDIPRLTAVAPSISVSYSPGVYHLECRKGRWDMGAKQVQQLIDLAKLGIQSCK